MERIALPAAPPSIWRRKRTWFLYAPLTLFFTLLIAAFICWHLAHADPDWYRPISIDDPNFQNLVDHFQLKTAVDANNAIERVPLEDQTFSVTDGELNAFMVSETAGQTNTSRAITDPTILFSPGHITVSARLPQVPGSRPEGGVITASYALKMADAPSGDADPHRRLLLTLERAWIGKLRIPISLITNRQTQLRDALEPALRKSLSLTDGTLAAADSPRGTEFHDALTQAVAGEPFLPVFYRPKKRPMIVKDVVLTDGTITITIGLR